MFYQHVHLLLALAETTRRKSSFLVDIKTVDEPRVARPYFRARALPLV